MKPASAVASMGGNGNAKSGIDYVAETLVLCCTVAFAWGIYLSILYPL